MAEKETLSLKEKLLKIRVELKVKKSKYSSFGKYYFRSLEDIQEALKPLEEKYRAVTMLHDNIEVIGDRYYLIATATLVDLDSSDEIKTQSIVREVLKKDKMDESQTTGSASSYARKYALQALYGIDDGEDSDSINDAQEQAKKDQEQTNKVSKEQKEVTALFNDLVTTLGDKSKIYDELGMTKAQFLNDYNYKTKDLLTQMKLCFPQKTEN